MLRMMQISDIKKNHRCIIALWNTSGKDGRGRNPHAEPLEGQVLQVAAFPSGKGSVASKNKVPQQGEERITLFLVS